MSTRPRSPAAVALRIDAVFCCFRPSRFGEGPTRSRLSGQGVLGTSFLSFQLPSRNCPPSTAASVAENAPINKDAVNQNESRAAALRASSISCFAVSMTSVTLFSASAWLIPVRDATTRAT
jgi:hypothetical protein